MYMSTTEHCSSVQGHGRLSRHLFSSEFFLLYVLQMGFVSLLLKFVRTNNAGVTSSLAFLKTLETRFVVRRWLNRALCPPNFQPVVIVVKCSNVGPGWSKCCSGACFQIGTSGRFPMDRHNSNCAHQARKHCKSLPPQTCPIFCLFDGGGIFSTESSSSAVDTSVMLKAAMEWPPSSF